MLLSQFQSLSRDSGRLNGVVYHEALHLVLNVSIPQSGFGAFEPLWGPVGPGQG